MADFNTPYQASSGKWIYQGEEFDKNPLAKAEPKKVMDTNKTKVQVKSKSRDKISEALQQAEQRKKQYSGGLAGMLGL